MNIVIVGQGAIGLLWYSTLYNSIKNKYQQSAINLSLRPSKISNDIPDILRFTNIDGVCENLPLHIASEEHVKAADVILICVKSYQVNQAILSISPFIKDTASVVLSHNGMGTIDELPADIINNHDILILLMTHGSLKTQPWEIKHTGQGICDLGLFNEIDKNKMLCLTKILNTALPKVTFQENISEKQWLKLAINCVINPLTAINNIDNGQILSDKFTVIIKDVLEEVIVIASYQQVILDPEMLTKTVLQVANATAQNQSSMLCDVKAQRKTEIDYINGYIVRLGEKYHCPTPANSRLWYQVSELTHLIKVRK